MKKISLYAAITATTALAACESMKDPVIQRDTVRNEQGVYTYGELKESYDGSRYRNFWAQNNNSFPVCVGLTLGENSTTSGHQFKGTHYLAPGEKTGVGYVYAPADYTVDHNSWTPDASGNC
ncbi:MAG TPA: hypothetical protein EYG02_10205 [Henriciella marina]|uniref:hypothetical protein n=1 Tax=Henriciella sp. TaxID=1968823 RepID=UPI0018150D27|nr:hypothetical protein [Henriciella sp.]HIG23947.1 hypothetical protein [Henriciella sp.]HIK65385.1 hypothetical protein [Henriciella marina]